MKHSPIRLSAIAYLRRQWIRHANFVLSHLQYCHMLKRYMLVTIPYSLVNKSYCVLGFLNQFHWQDVTNLEPHTYTFPFKLQYADVALIFVDSDVFAKFYLRSLFKGVSQMSETVLEMIAVIKLCSSMIQTQTTKTKETEQQAVWLAAHNLTTRFLLICF